MENPSGYTPVDMRVLVKPDQVEEITAGGIIKPQTTADREKFAGTKAKLIAVGSNAFKDWGDQATKPAPGARVHFAQYSGSRYKGDDGDDYIVMNDGDLCGIIGCAQ